MSNKYACVEVSCEMLSSSVQKKKTRIVLVCFCVARTYNGYQDTIQLKAAEAPMTRTPNTTRTTGTNPMETNRQMLLRKSCPLVSNVLTERCILQLLSQQTWAFFPSLAVTVIKERCQNPLKPRSGLISCQDNAACCKQRNFVNYEAASVTLYKYHS